MVSADADANASAVTDRWVIDSKYCLPYETMLIMQEDFMWQKDADIKDTTGTVHFRVKAKPWPMTFKRVLFDADGNPVVCLDKKSWSFSLRMSVCPGAEHDPDLAYFEARKKVWSFTPVMEIYLRGNRTDTPDVTCKGDFFNRNFTLMSREGKTLAEISRSVVVKAVMFHVDSYSIRIMAGVDMAAVVAAVMCVDLIHVEERRRRSRSRAS